MTRYRIRIEEMVLHGVPPELAEGIGSAVEERLSALAGGAAPGSAGHVRTTGDLADRIAGTVWQQVSGAGAP